MKRTAYKLQSKFVETVKEPGKYLDGRGLYLVVKPKRDSVAKLWSLRFMLHGMAREMGLGTYPSVSLSTARANADDAHRLIAQSLDPIKARDTKKNAEMQAALKAKGAHSFDVVAAEYIESKRANWKSKKHATQWEASLRRYASGVIGKMAVHEIGTDDVLKVLKPIWISKNETATRVRNRIELILDSAFAKAPSELRNHHNPARWRHHLDKLLPQPSRVKKSKHFESLPYTDIGEFLFKLRNDAGAAARALEFLIYQPLRSIEVRGIRWQEIDFKKEVWTIPGPRLKGNRDDFRVPLSQPALEILRALRSQSEQEHIFVGQSKRTSLLSENTFAQTIKRLGYKATAHGFRSTFTVWGQEVPRFHRDLLDLCLAHAEKDKVYAAYGRSDRLEERREVTNAWAEFCQSEYEKARKAADNFDAVPLSLARAARQKLLSAGAEA